MEMQKNFIRSATIALHATKYLPGLSRNSATLLSKNLVIDCWPTARRYSYPLILLMLKLKSFKRKRDSWTTISRRLCLAKVAQ